jgi:hypothetical protein
MKGELCKKVWLSVIYSKFVSPWHKEKNWQSEFGRNLRTFRSKQQTGQGRMPSLKYHKTSCEFKMN